MSRHRFKARQTIVEEFVDVLGQDASTGHALGFRLRRRTCLRVVEIELVEDVVAFEPDEPVERIKVQAIEAGAA